MVRDSIPSSESRLPDLVENPRPCRYKDQASVWQA